MSEHDENSDEARQEFLRAYYAWVKTGHEAPVTFKRRQEAWGEYLKARYAYLGIPILAPMAGHGEDASA